MFIFYLFFVWFIFSIIQIIREVKDSQQWQKILYGKLRGRQIVLPQHRWRVFPKILHFYNRLDFSWVDCRRALFYHFLPIQKRILCVSHYACIQWKPNLYSGHEVLMTTHLHPLRFFSTHLSLCIGLSSHNTLEYDVFLFQCRCSQLGEAA